MLEGVAARNQRRVALLACAHPLDVVSFETDHFGVVNDRPIARFHFDQFACSARAPQSALRTSSNLAMSHRPFQRIAHQGAFIHHCLTFQVAVAGERHCRLRMPDLPSSLLGSIQACIFSLAASTIRSG